MSSRFLWATALLLFAVAAAAPTREKQYFFDNIPASEDLQWYPCNQTYFCARLSVPLNPLDPLNGLRNEIPIIKLPANDTCEYKGIVLTNPGGPGGLGIGFILASGLQIQNFTGPGYDIIGFDPRGMGYSKPNGAIDSELSTVPVNPTRVNATYLRSSKYLGKRDSREDKYGIFVPPRSDLWLEGIYNVSIAFNEALKNVSADNQALPYMGTPNVAFDMLQIAKADARARGQNCTDNVLVNYYGVSYGTVLGQTFASIYPQHVGKFVIDSVVDLEAWYNARLEDQDLVLEHADEGFHEFFKDCFNAGPQLCSFYTGNSADDIRNRWNRLFSAFDPAKAEKEKWANATLVNAGLDGLKLILNNIGYNSIATFPKLSETLATIDGLLNANNFTEQSIVEIGQAWFPPTDSASPDRGEYTIETWCTDTYNRTLRGSNKPIPQNIVDLVRERSVTTGERLLQVYGLCSHLNLKPKWRFNYPIGVKTKNPILFIGLTIDLITPIRNARTASKLYKGAQLLTVDAVGHGILDKDNWCSFEKTRQYYQHGILPGRDNHCAKGAIPFINTPSWLAGTPGSSKRDLESARRTPFALKWGFPLL